MVAIALSLMLRTYADDSPQKLRLQSFRGISPFLEVAYRIFVVYATRFGDQLIFEAECLRVEIALPRTADSPFYAQYLDGFTFYKMTSLDNRIANADQLLAQDVDRFCEGIVELYSNLSKDEVGFVSVEVAISGIIALICFFGIALNASLVYVTVKSKSIHSKCNVLIALYAFFAIFLLIGFCVKIFIFLFGINFITLGTCFWIQFISRSACVMAIILQLCIGVERLVAFSFPIWYNMSGKYLVFKVLLIICLIKVIVDKCVDFYGSSKHWEKLVRCELSDPANQPEIIGYTVYSMLIIVVAEILCYAMLWLINWWRKSLTDLQGKRMLRSISLIMSINLIFNIGTNICFQYVFGWFNLNEFTLSHIARPVAYAFFVVGHCSSASVLFITSSVYRRAYQSVLWQNHHQVTPVQNLQRQPNITNNVRRTFANPRQLSNAIE
ncbi:hypothetical protein niasHT_013802 [Heterodera trifolii]|uniref:ABC transmembrane type-1 domain-containing protein n=1 Tax=Heterodera trifolii TaxID=157864 RepID=A0ABD2KTK8_9BILA